MKKILCLLLAVLLCLSVFAACGGKKPITAQKAQEIAVKDAGTTLSEAKDIHTHIGTAEDGSSYYNIHFSADGENYNYMISSKGEILSVTNEAGH